MQNSECRLRNTDERAGQRLARLAWVAVVAAISFPSLNRCPGDDSAALDRTQQLRGRVVYLAEAFEKQTGVPSVFEAQDRILALQTAGGRLIPLLEDVRGRAFRRDERLRGMEVELAVQRYPQSPVVQILRVIEVTPGGRYEIDYWCEICAIAMFELKDCECCQGEIELRRRKVE